MRRVRTTTVVAEKQGVLHNLCVCVALGIQHAIRMRHFVICGLPRSTLFFHNYLINGKIFGGKKLLKIKCVCIKFVYNIFLKNFSF
jgi:hypothetical protein